VPSASSRPPPLLVGALVLALGTLGPLGLGARDEGADGVFSERKSLHFVLLQDVDIDQRTGVRGSRRFESDLLEVLEAAHDRVGKLLGVRPRGPIRVVVYDDADFERRFGRHFRFRAAGFFDGAIHVRAATEIEPRLVRTLHHEYVHAAFGYISPGWHMPGWVNEGVAEYVENLSVGKRHLSSGERRVLVDRARDGDVVPLAALNGPGFARLSPEEAAVAYLQSYATVEYLVRKRGGDRELRRFCDRLLGSRDLERALRKVYGLDLEGLDRELRTDFERR
jgi:hypothetical protein